MSKMTLAQSPYPGAHCPVPVFLLFDSVEVLTRADSSFSDGSLRWGCKLYSTAEDLTGLPWKLIYHNTRHQPSRRDITYHRNAEVVVPRRLELDALRYIICRSQAEKDTLLHLLPPDVWLKYHRKILATRRISLYYCRHTFVKTARLSSQKAIFEFSPDTTSSGPFHLRVEFRPATGHPMLYDRDQYLANAKLRLRLPRPLPQYDVTLKLDKSLAYAGRYEDYEIPF